MTILMLVVRLDIFAVLRVFFNLSTILLDNTLSEFIVNLIQVGKTPAEVNDELVSCEFPLNFM
jgi:hypothetical protein